ncbi:MAG: hypothetical protein QM500_04940 [Methylococcales bacterium]
MQPKITLKNIKYSAFMSEETICFEATVYKDNKRWCVAKNDGHGGCTAFNPIQGMSGSVMWKEVSAFNQNAKSHESTCGSSTLNIKEDLEWVVSTLINDWLELKELKKVLKKPTAYNPEDNSIVQWNTSFKPNMVEEINKKWPHYVVMNELPQDEALLLFRKAS